ncbi:hypothetical protein K458DRAFT_418833 [Lentithecium fluviatile CBS 122367]|uniref:Uncharacterized protein n=1 Tax=Lentithecium fluviatile CBS 122367 TaxID=1168545 RepID=A0A6G1J037_9PLEO|nr:hypothetical protein K458DRAFT_418833 [Lentithecium fluviatile CBS 122367]
MPLKAANTVRRKGPSFNPPRPVKPAAQTSTTTKRASGTAASRATGGSKPAASRSDILPAAAILSSDEDFEEDNNEAQSDGDELMEDAPEEEDRRQSGVLDNATPPIPQPLLARLLYENFEDDKTQIQKGAMNLFSSYMSIFVREAIARAKDERDKAARRGGRSEAFLQVEDLEKLAPQLVLDF